MPVYKRTPLYKSFSSTTVSTVANTAVETAFSSNYIIPANSMTVGKTYRIKSHGVYSTKSTTSGTLSVSPYLGSTKIVSDINPGTTAALNNVGWMQETEFVVVSLGSTGTIEAQGFEVRSINSNTPWSYVMRNTSVVTIDTTVNQLVTLQAVWVTADVANSITLRQLVVEVLG